MTSNTPLDPKSPQARRILKHLTPHPCPKAEHRKAAYARLVVTDEDGGQPRSRFTNGQILFYGCIACQEAVSYTHLTLPTKRIV